MKEYIEAFNVFNLYDLYQHRKFIEGNKVKDNILAHFLNSFNGVKGSHDEAPNFQVDVCISKKKFFTTKLITWIEKCNRKIEKV